jgi:hypothetical protein
MKSILDPTFRYTPSTHTDIAKTFARIRREQGRTARAVREPEAPPGRTLSLVARLPLRKLP